MRNQTTRSDMASDYLRGCARKFRYKTEKLANRVKKKINVNGDGSVVHSYPCNFCGGWHVGRVPAKPDSGKPKPKPKPAGIPRTHRPPTIDDLRSAKVVGPIGTKGLLTLSRIYSGDTSVKFQPKVIQSLLRRDLISLADDGSHKITDTGRAILWKGTDK